MEDPNSFNIYIYSVSLSQCTEGPQLLLFACDFSYVSVPFFIGCVISEGKT